MNQKEYNLIANVIRDRKKNAENGIHFGYSRREIDHALNTLADLQDILVYELRNTYDNFDEAKFTNICSI